MGGSTTRSGLDGGSGVEVALYLSGGDSGRSFVLEN